MPGATHVILCADDYGLCPPVSQGIVTLARAGRLSATSVMTLSPAWPRDAAPLRELRGMISVGLHLDWTSGFARSSGYRLGLHEAMWRAAAGRPKRAGLVEHIERQCDAFESAWKAPPDHVDGHQHLHQFRGIRQAVFDVLDRRYGAMHPWLRISRVAQPGVKARIISAFGSAALQREARARQWPSAAPLRGVYSFAGGLARYGRLMRGWLLAAKVDGGVIMCHPAQAGSPGDPIEAARVWEYAYLGSPTFLHLLGETGVQLTTRPDPVEFRQ